MTEAIRSTPLVVAAPPPPPSRNVAIPKDQVDLNIEVYEKVFGKCIEAATRLLEERQMDYSTAQKVEVAKAIFDRFYQDQGIITQANIQSEKVVSSISRLFEGRR